MSPCPRPSGGYATGLRVSASRERSCVAATASVEGERVTIERQQHSESCVTRNGSRGRRVSDGSNATHWSGKSRHSLCGLRTQQNPEHEHASVAEQEEKSERQAEVNAEAAGPAAASTRDEQSAREAAELPMLVTLFRRFSENEEWRKNAADMTLVIDKRVREVSVGFAYAGHGADTKRTGQNKKREKRRKKKTKKKREAREGEREQSFGTGETEVSTRKMQVLDAFVRDAVLCPT